MRAAGAALVRRHVLTDESCESAPLQQRRHRAALPVRVPCPVCGAENLVARCPHDASFVGDVTVEQVTALALELLR